MKKIVFIMALLLVQAWPVFSQEDSTSANDQEIKTLFHKSDKKITVGFYIGPEAAYTQFKGKDVWMGGMSMGLILNHSFSIGLAGYGILNSGNLWYDNIDSVYLYQEVGPGTYQPRGAYLYGGYMGVKFEYKLFATSPVHVNFPLLIGGGGMFYNTWTYHNGEDYNYDSYYGETLDSDAFFVLEPGVQLEINLLKFMRLDAGVTYRYTPDLDLKSTPSSLINSFNATVSLKFGKF